MSTSINKIDNELIRKRRKKQKIKKMTLFVVFMIIFSVVLAYKLPFFNIKEINIQGNKLLKKEKILSLSGVEIGDNIFYINSKKIEKSIKRDSYISEVSVKRKLPNKIYISIIEKNEFYSYLNDKKLYVLDDKGMIVNIGENLSEKPLMKVINKGDINGKVGEVINLGDKHKVEFMGKLSEILKENISDIHFTSVDVSNMADIKLYVNNMIVKIGNDDNLKDKLNKAINIITAENLKNVKGYVDISFNGMPVVYRDK